MQRTVSNAAAGEIDGRTEEGEIEIGVAGRERRKRSLPQNGSRFGIGTRKIDHHLKAPRECRIEIATEIRRQNARPLMRLDAREQVTHFEVRVAIARFAHLSPLAEQRIRFVELQHHRAAVRRIEQMVEILLGLTDVLRYEPSEIDAIERPSEIGGDDRGRERLAGS